MHFHWVSPDTLKQLQYTQLGSLETKCSMNVQPAFKVTSEAHTKHVQNNCKLNPWLPAMYIVLYLNKRQLKRETPPPPLLSREAISLTGLPLSVLSIISSSLPINGITVIIFLIIFSLTYFQMSSCSQGFLWKPKTKMYCHQNKQKSFLSIYPPKIYAGLHTSNWNYNNKKEEEKRRRNHPALKPKQDIMLH